LIEAGAADLLRADGIDVTVQQVERGGPFRDTASSAGAVNRRLAAVVAQATDRGALPVVLAGSCNSCLGVLAGFDHSHCGAVWLDAHADFNTPASSRSGFFPGMSLANATGRCYADYWGQAPLPEDSVFRLGLTLVEELGAL
jgi:arginase